MLDVWDAWVACITAEAAAEVVAALLAIAEGIEDKDVWTLASESTQIMETLDPDAFAEGQTELREVSGEKITDCGSKLWSTFLRSLLLISNCIPCLSILIVSSDTKAIVAPGKIDEINSELNEVITNSNSILWVNTVN